MLGIPCFGRLVVVNQHKVVVVVNNGGSSFLLCRFCRFLLKVGDVVLVVFTGLRRFEARRMAKGVLARRLNMGGETDGFSL